MVDDHISSKCQQKDKKKTKQTNNTDKKSVFMEVCTFQTGAEKSTEALE